MRTALAFLFIALSAIGQDADFRRQVRSTTYTRDLLEATTAASARRKLGVFGVETAAGIETNWTSLLAYTGATNGQSISVLDRGGFVWRFVAGATETNLANPAVGTSGVWQVQNWNGDVRAFGVKSDGYYNTNTSTWTGTDNTVALQAAIDKAIADRTFRLLLPAGVMISERPASWTNEYRFILSYNSYLASSTGMLRQSATYPAGRSDGWDQYQHRTFEIEGISPNDVAPVVGQQGADRLIGSCLVIKGGTNEYAIATGGSMAGVKLSKFAIFGEGSSVTRGGVRVEVLASNTKLEDITIIDVHTGVGIGDQALDGAADVLSDWSFLERCTIQFVDTCVRVGAANSFITRITHPKFRGRVGIDNRVNNYGASYSKINPQIVVDGGYIQADHGVIDGVIDGGNYYISGVVTNVSGQDITIDASTLQKVTSLYGTSVPSTNVGALSDIATNMLIGVYGNTILGKAREEVPALNRVTNISGSTLTLRGYVNTNNVIGKRFIVQHPAVAFIGSNFRVYGTEVELQRANMRTVPQMLLWNETYSATDIFDGMRFQSFPTTATNQSEMEMIWPRIYTEVPVSGLEGPLEFRGGVIRASHFVSQVGDRPAKFQSMTFGTWPMFIDHTGADAPRVVLDSCKFTYINRDNSDGNKTTPEWANRGIFPKTVLSNGIPVTPIYFTEQPPAATGTGDLLVRPHHTPTIAERQFGTITTTSPHMAGYYDSSSFAGSFTNDVAVDPYKITFGDFSTLYVGRVVSLAGAGIGGQNLIARITDIGHDTNGVRFARINVPMGTTVSGASIGNTTAYTRGFGRQADFYGGFGTPTSSRYAMGDIIWRGNPMAGDELGWIVPKTGASDSALPIGIVGLTSLAYRTNLGYTISATPTQSEVQTLLDAFNTLLADLQTANLMRKTTNDTTFTNILYYTQPALTGQVTIASLENAAKWTLRETAAGAWGTAAYFSVDVRGALILTNWVNLFATGSNVAAAYSSHYHGNIHLTNTTGIGQGPAWEPTRPAFDFRDTASSNLWFARNSTLNIGTAGFQTYQIRDLELYTLGDGSIIKNNHTTTNNFEIRVTALGSPYLRYYDSIGTKYDFTFDRVRLQIGKPTTLLLHIDRDSHADLYVDGVFSQSVALFGIDGISIASDYHGFATEAGQTLRFFVKGLTVYSGRVWL